MSFKYIAIEREYGSGGTEVAYRLAEECGIDCYGQEILEAVSKKYNLSIDQLQRYEESASNSFLYTVYVMGQMQSGSSDMLSEEAKLLVAEHDYIRETALRGPAIYLGHCAAQALKDQEVLKVYIHCSDEGKKGRRIVTDYGIPTDEVDKTRKRFDNKRARFYYANTASKWDNFRNYDIVLDSATLGIDGCVKALEGFVKKQETPKD